MTEAKPSQRFSCLKAEQVEVLHQVLSNIVPIHGRGNFPTLELRPRDIIIAVRARLQQQGITVRDVRLNGSTASHVLVRDNGTSYKDLDIIFGVELPSQEEFQVIKESVLGCLLDCLPAGVNRERISSATMKEAYVQKMVKVFNEHDRWSLISLSNNSGKNLELKFVSTLRRQFEFSVDSFQIILDRLLEFYIQQEALHRQRTVDLNKDVSRQNTDTSFSMKKVESEKLFCQETSGEKDHGPGEKEQRQKDQESEWQNEAFNQTDDKTIPNPKEQLTEETKTETERRHDSLDLSNSLKQSKQTEFCDDSPHPNQPPAEHREPVRDSTETESAITLAESSNHPEESPHKDETNISQTSLEETKSQLMSAPSDHLSSQEAEMAEEVEDETRQQTESSTDTSQISVYCSVPATAHTGKTKSIDCLCSSSLKPHNTQQTGVEETHNLLNSQTPDKSLETLDIVNPLDTQDSLAAPSSLVTDRKTSSPTIKASERLSHMVVLKHASPKPPRRMCRKVAASSHTSSEFNTLCTEPNTSSVPKQEPGEPSQNQALPTETDIDPNLSNDQLDFSSGCDEVPTLALESALPQESCDNPKDTLYVAPDPSGSDESSSKPQELDHLETLDVLLLQELNSDTQDLTITSQNEPDTETPESDIRTQESLLISPQAFDSVTPQASCLNLPILSLPPPCLSPSPPSLSPPPCLTPLSQSSPMLSAFSPTPSFSSPPLSFSPTSSGLSSPPYLTPPMLSLSPPPLCLTPPSPCLSPPVLCLTPPRESEDLIPQVCSTTEPVILNPDKKEIKESSIVLLADKNKQDYISVSTQAADPVSFPVTIPGSTIHSQPLSGDSIPTSLDKDAMAEGKVEEQTSTIDSVPAVEVLAESMYGDFEAAMDHLRYRLIATRNPEEIRGGGLLKYSNLLVRDYRPASETQIKTLERYMCSRFFIDFPDVQEQQRKILSYLKNHFIGEERSKYQYLMTLRRVVDNSTVCLMGHERRQTLNMITVLALRVLGEQNIIPNTDHVTCFYQPAPYLAEHSTPYITEPSYCSYYIPQGGSTLLYQPYPLHLHSQTGLV